MVIFNARAPFLAVFFDVTGRVAGLHFRQHINSLASFTNTATLLSFGAFCIIPIFSFIPPFIMAMFMCIVIAGQIQTISLKASNGLREWKCIITKVDFNRILARTWRQFLLADWFARPCLFAHIYRKGPPKLLLKRVFFYSFISKVEVCDHWRLDYQIKSICFSGNYKSLNSLKIYKWIISFILFLSR